MGNSGNKLQLYVFAGMFCRNVYYDILGRGN